MKMKKSFLAVLLSILFMFSSFAPSMSVYASNNPVETGSNFLKNHWNKSITWLSGVITTSVDYTRDFLQWLTSHKSDYNIPEGTSAEDWLDNNVQISQDGNITISDSVVNSVRDVINNYIVNDTGFVYVYSTPASAYINTFNNQTQYHAFIDVLNSNNDNICLAYTGAPYIWVSEYPCELVDNGYLNGTLKNVSTYYNWQTANFYKYSWDSSSQTYIKSDSYDTPGYQRTVRLSPDDTMRTGYTAICSAEVKQMKMYKNTDSMRAGTEGVQQYYVTDSYNTSHVTGSYNTTLTNLDNSISYSDVSNYVNSYYINNQVYPSSQDTYNYINNYNGSGGSGGSGGSDSDDDDDDGWDWGFLDTISGFFKGLLKALKTAIEGILDLLTGIIDLFIGEEQPDGTRSGGLPTIIGKLIAYFMPFLPEWCTQLIGFSVLLALILGVIKLVRGH